MGKSMRGFVASLNSDNGLYHNASVGCHHAGRIKAENAMKFRSAEKAQRRGLRLCRTCSQLARQRRLSEYA